MPPRGISMTYPTTEATFDIIPKKTTTGVIQKADVLDTFQEINVCTNYIINGKKIDYLPFELMDAEVKADYQTIEAWNSSLDQIKDMNKLPEKYLDYIKFIEEQTKTKISVLSLGPDRTQTIIR